MSVPTNPLSNFSTYEVKHILAAYKDTPSAESYNLTISSGEIGDEVSNGIVVVNEFKDSIFTIPTVVWKWTKTGPHGISTTCMEGTLELADATGGRFLDWFRTNVIQVLGKSTDHLTFALKTYFIGTNKQVTPEKHDVITGNQLIFHVHNIKDIMNSTSEATRVRLDFSSAYNTTAQSTTVSKPYQITLTHKSGNLTNADPEKSKGSCDIMSRGEEDAAFSRLRKTRVDKSKPMRTLKDLFDAFETELNQQPEVHKAQVQTWLGQIRDNYTTKIKPPKQERGEKLPIKFEMKLDPEYYEYKVDNRNLPFEQTEELPDKTKGVTAVPFRAGATITEMIETLMKYSIKVGEDAALPTDAKTFATNLSYSVENDMVIIKIKVKKITVPYNSQEFGDTGAGEGAIEPLMFTFKSGEADDLDITYMKTYITTDAGIIPLEKPITDSVKKPLVVFGNREPLTGERIPTSAPGDKFFDSGYSGLRVPVGPYANTGLENAEAASNVDIMNMIKSDQRSYHEIEIRGNPYLMFDMHRFPSKAAQLDNKGEAHYYKIPESFPMYLKIDIFIKSDAVIGLYRSQENLPIKYFYQNHYEISGIVNNLTDGAFYQLLSLKKTDDVI